MHKKKNTTALRTKLMKHGAGLGLAHPCSCAVCFYKQEVGVQMEDTEMSCDHVQQNKKKTATTKHTKLMKLVTSVGLLTHPCSCVVLLRTGLRVNPSSEKKMKKNMKKTMTFGT